MGFFNKPAQQADIQTDTTVISGSTSIEGSIHSKCPLQIDGTHQGTIEAKSTVTIGQQGKVEGELTADTLSVTGAFQGTAECENVQIHAGGTLRGKVISNNLTIDQDCTFEGESVKKSMQKKAHAKPAKKAPTDLPGNLSVS